MKYQVLFSLKKNEKNIQDHARLSSGDSEIFFEKQNIRLTSKTNCVVLYPKVGHSDLVLCVCGCIGVCVCWGGCSMIRCMH